MPELIKGFQTSDGIAKIDYAAAIENKPVSDTTLLQSGAFADSKTVGDKIVELNNNKVEKINNKGLSSNDYTDEEKEKLESLENYDDNSIKESLTVLDQAKVNKIDGKGLSTNDYTTLEKSKLESLENYDDTKIKQDIDNINNTKVDKSVGKGLSTNDFTDEEKEKLESLENYDDTEIRTNIESNITSINELQLNKVAVDITLSSEGDAAEAKTTGSKLNELNMNVENLKNTLKPVFAFSTLNKFAETYFAMQRTGKVYTVKFPLWETSTACTGDKLDDNTGLTCVPSTDTVVGVNDYDNIALFSTLDCNAIIDENGNRTITAIKGMKEFKDVGAVDVFVLQMDYYEKYWESDGYWYYSRTDSPREGYTLVQASRNKDGSRQGFCLYGKYVMGYVKDSNKCYMSKNLAPARYISGAMSQECHNDSVSYNWGINNLNRGTYYTLGTMSDYMHISTTFYLMFATTNSQSIMYGNTNNYVQYLVSETENNTTRVILTSAQANNIDILSCVSVGDVGSNTTLDRVYGYVHNLADCAVVLSKETLESGNVALYLQHEPFTTTATTYVTTMHERSGYSDKILGRTGSIRSNTNGKHGFVLCGIECCVGGYEVSGNAFMDITDDINNRNVYLMNDASVKTTDINKAKTSYTLLSTHPSVSSTNTWNYINKIHIDTENGIILNVSTGLSGSGSSIGFADGQYFDASTSGQREFLLLGRLSHGSLAGLSLVYGNTGLGSADWSFLARLSVNCVSGVNVA